MIDGISSLIQNISDKFFPDANAKLEFERYAMQQANSIDLAQIEVQKAAANHKSIFVAGARPFILWCCGAAFAANFVLLPIAVQFAPLFGAQLELVALDMTQMMPVLLGLLGLGGLRSAEKMRGVHTNSISNKLTDFAIQKLGGK